MGRCLITIAFLVATQTGARAEEEEPAKRMSPAASAHLARGEAEFQKGRYAEALKAFEAAHDASPGQATGEWIGRCQEKLGRLDDAIATFKHLAAMESDPFKIDEYRRRLRMLKEKKLVHEDAASVGFPEEPAPAPTKGKPEPAAGKGSTEPAAGKGSAEPAAAKGGEEPATPKGSAEPAAALAPYVKFFDYCKRKAQKAAVKSGKVQLRLKAAGGKTEASVVSDAVGDTKFAACLKSAARHVDAAVVGEGIDYEVELPGGSAR